MHVRLRARDHHAVNGAEQALEIETFPEGRDHDRKHPGGRQRGLQILARSGMPDIAVERPHVGGNGDQWLGGGRLGEGRLGHGGNRCRNCDLHRK